MQYETKLMIWFRDPTPSSRKVRQCQSDEFQPYPFLGINNITVPVKKGRKLFGWLTSKEKIFTNASITSFDDTVDNSILDAEGNVCGIITKPIIETTFDNDYIHVLHDITKRYIHGYFISKLINSEATIQNIILKSSVYS